VRARQEMNAKMKHRDGMRRDIKSEAQGDLSKEQEGVLKTSVVANAMFHEQNEAGGVTGVRAFRKARALNGTGVCNSSKRPYVVQSDAPL
jgi:hypothetical protein